MMDAGVPESPLIEWCAQFVSRDKAFVDVGAHIGTWAWTLGPRAKCVHAFEPNRAVYNVLCANIALKRQSEFTRTYNFGLSSTADTLRYFTRSSDGGGNGFTRIGGEAHGIELNVRPLDDFNIESVGFMKIDVEGHEKEVLQGATKTLEASEYPPFVFESWASWRHACAQDLRHTLFDYVLSLDYTIVPIAGFGEMFLATRTP